jgi:hypothetical protein
MAVFCSSLILCFPGVAREFSECFAMVPVDTIINGITFHGHCIFTVRSLYL